MLPILMPNGLVIRHTAHHCQTKFSIHRAGLSDRLALLTAEDEVSGLVLEDRSCVCFDWSFHGDVHDQNRLLYDKVTVLESEKRAWENSPEAQAVRDALNPWRHLDTEATKKS